jgi:hypothetical protein
MRGETRAGHSTVIMTDTCDRQGADTTRRDRIGAQMVERLPEQSSRPATTATGAPPAMTGMPGMPEPLDAPDAPDQRGPGTFVVVLVSVLTILVVVAIVVAVFAGAVFGLGAGHFGG